MANPPDPEMEVRRSVHALLDAWARADAASIDQFLALVADDASGFGTGRRDHYTDRTMLREMTLREEAEMPFPISLELPWMDVRLLRPDLALVDGEVHLSVHAGPEPLVVAPRFSFLLERRGDAWPLLHMHFSIPDTMLDEQDTLGSALEERNRELERLVARRTEELERSLDDLRTAQARLVQQEKMASLGTLTAGVAHEIKNPLNFVNNFAALSRELVEELVEELDGASDPEEVRALLDDLRANAEKIEAHGRRADGIVRSMLEHARSGTGERRAVDLNTLVSEYAGLARHGGRALAADPDVEISESLDPAVGRVEVTPPDVGRVVLNLVRNALDAVRERADGDDAGYVPAVSISTHRAGDRVEIRVSDNGIGLPEDAEEKIFEPFYTTKPTGSGTGLGLSLSFDIVAQGHGGTLAAERRPDGGAVFIVDLPAPPLPADPDR